EGLALACLLFHSCCRFATCHARGRSKFPPPTMRRPSQTPKRSSFFSRSFRVRGPTTTADFMNVLIASQCSGYQTASHEHRPILRSGCDEILDILRVGDQQIGAGADRDAPVRAETE